LSSNLGDQLNNPAIKPAISGEELSNWDYVKHGVAEGAIGTLEMARMLSSLGGGIRHVKGKDLFPEGIKGENPISESSDALIKKLKTMNEHPEPKTWPQKFSKAGGEAGVGLIQGGLGAATSPKMRTLANLLAETGGAVAQTFGSPAVKEWAPKSPFVQIPLNILLGISGALTGGGVGAAVKNNAQKPLPKMTAAQMAENGSPEQFALWQKQENLMKNDRLSAQYGHEIQKAQHGDISGALHAPQAVSGEDLAEQIIAAFEQKKATRSADYKENLQNAIEASSAKPKQRYVANEIGDVSTGIPTGESTQGYPYKKVKLNDTEATIDQMLQNVAVGGKKEKLLLDTRDFIRRQEGHPWKLNDLKKELQDDINYSKLSSLYLGNSRKSALETIVDSVVDDLEKTVPGYKKLLSDYHIASKELEGLQKGVVGKYVKGAEHNPHDLLSNIFENPNPGVFEQIKSVLTPEQLQKAEQTYVMNLKNQFLNKGSKTQFNDAEKYLALRKHLENHWDALSHTLSEPMKETVENAISQIKKSEIGVPTGEFRKNVGTYAPSGSDIHVGGTSYQGLRRLAGKTGMNKLHREEMLTGVSPMAQVGELGKKAAIHTGVQANISRNVSDSKSPQKEWKPPHDYADVTFEEPNLKEFDDYESNMPMKDIEVPTQEESLINDFDKFESSMKMKKKGFK
jgi:hypothetical protein